MSELGCLIFIDTFLRAAISLTSNSNEEFFCHVLGPSRRSRVQSAAALVTIEAIPSLASRKRFVSKTKSS